MVRCGDDLGLLQGCVDAILMLMHLVKVNPPVLKLNVSVSISTIQRFIKYTLFLKKNLIMRSLVSVNTPQTAMG